MVTELLHRLASRWYFVGSAPIEKQSVTNALSANSLRFAQIYFFAMGLFYELWNVNGNGVEQNLDVLSENGQLLKTWKISDKNDPSVRIFQETSWRFYQKPQLQHVSTCEVAWVFDILPADIE